MDHEVMDNTTPLRKKDLHNPAVVQAVESIDDTTETTSHPQDNPKNSAEEIKEANRSVAGGGHDGSAGGSAKGSSGAGATAGGPFQSESGQTLKEEGKGAKP